MSWNLGFGSFSTIRLGLFANHFFSELWTEENRKQAVRVAPGIWCTIMLNQMLHNVERACSMKKASVKYKSTTMRSGARICTSPRAVTNVDQQCEQAILQGRGCVYTWHEFDARIFHEGRIIGTDTQTAVAKNTSECKIAPQQLFNRGKCVDASDTKHRPPCL